MITPTPARAPDARNGKQASAYSHKSLDSRIEDLALWEYDAVRRRDWSIARTFAEEKAALQAARQRVLAKRLA